jgi:asparagine synthase (glutamine-hydrolysing)
VCGIAGIWGATEEGVVRHMMDRLAHRGPDADGIYITKSGVLGHRRLAIMDLEGGTQPIKDEGLTRALIANGEIYNYKQIRDYLRERHCFRTRSDSESILHLYEDLNETGVRALNGMYTIAIADGQDLFLARDPLGIKPLYYGYRDGNMVFASELKALGDLAHEVKEFPPGTYFHSQRGFRTFYQVPDKIPRNVPFELCSRILRETLEKAVVDRLMSDVPLGTFLSGGLDSSLIAALARPHLDKLHTFSVGVEGSRDLEAARLVARHLDTVHHEYILTVSAILKELPEIIYYLESFDQDLVRSGIPCYFVSKLASDHVKVILTGEGADELFAGYGYYKDVADPDALQQELTRSVTNLHNVNLQRVDRMTMAHSIEGRVPFLDMEMVHVALGIPPELKLVSRSNESPREKWILRKTFADLLPPEIVWRDKEQFDEGSGTAAMLSDVIESVMPEHEADAYRQEYTAANLRSAEECFYHKTVRNVFSKPKAILDNVARWSERPATTG